VTQLVLKEILDTSTLKQYVDVIGYDKFLQSVALFEELVPEYIERMQTYAEENEVVKLCQQAHQLKGAAGSIGLLRIQKYAQKLQNPEDALWEKKHLIWIENTARNTVHDLKILKAYLKEKLRHPV
tara:strand:+ start:4333 stop:4710 length:378 start_codon:yes stop_codon:yes gene_type:complete